MDIKTFIDRRINVCITHLYGVTKPMFFNSEDIRTDEEIIVSLTTHPARYTYAHRTIKSLLNQTYKPDKIVLWLSTKEPGALPDSLIQLKENGLIIKYTNRDLKSYLKLIPSLKEYPESTIITVDDDFIYPVFFIQEILKAHAESPRCVVAYNSRLMKKANGKEMLSYKNFNIVASTKPSFDMLPIGNMGVLYPPNTLNEEVFNHDVFLSLCPHADDIWFKAMTLLNNTKTRTVFPHRILFSDTENKTCDPLYEINCFCGENDKQIKNVFDRYDLYQYIEE